MNEKLFFLKKNIIDDEKRIFFFAKYAAEIANDRGEFKLKL